MAKMKEEVRIECQRLREEMQQEIKMFRESVERDFRNEIRELKTEQRSMTKSIDYAHDTIEELKKKLDEALAKNTQLETENAALRLENATLKSSLNDLEHRVTSCEQYSRNVNLEIQGVIKNENESVNDLLCKLGTAIGEPIAREDMEACHRVPSRTENKSHIVVQFKSRVKRDNVLKKAKKARLTNADLGISSSTPVSPPVYVNEHLCPTLKRLLALAVKKKYEMKWKSVWSFNGKIFARQSDATPVVHIPSVRDIDKIFVRQTGSLLA